MRMAQPDGQIGHAEIKIGDSPIMLADEYPEMGYRSPQSLGGSPVSILLYVENVDALFDQAVAAGGKVTMPVKDQFYGDRSGTLSDPFGHVWTIATRKEDWRPRKYRTEPPLPCPAISHDLSSRTGPGSRSANGRPRSRPIAVPRRQRLANPKVRL
jgi:uncharacterized glyoxalase superfamily protein PhnB